MGIGPTNNFVILINSDQDSDQEVSSDQVTFFNIKLHL